MNRLIAKYKRKRYYYLKKVRISLIRFKGKENKKEKKKKL